MRDTYFVYSELCSSCPLIVPTIVGLIDVDFFFDEVYPVLQFTVTLFGFIHVARCRHCHNMSLIQYIGSYHVPWWVTTSLSTPEETV